jgi:type I restriction enzyme R subunit
LDKYSEEALVEQPAIKLFEGLGWKAANCFDETFGPEGDLGRETRSEVVLTRRLKTSLENLNPDLPPGAIRLVIEELTRDRSALSLVHANHEIYELLKNGVKVTYRNEQGEDVVDTVRVIDWENPENNDFFLASQFWITGEMYTRRTDLLGFINGLPLVFIELKAVHKRLKLAYGRNLADCKEAIPHLFWYTGFIILSNGTESRIGTLSSEWEHFNEWKKINNEGEEGIVSLETIIRGMCDKTRLLDILEHFIIYSDRWGGLTKLIAKNHQYHGVNNAVQAVRDIQENKGRLGVFWHTQGSGKSYSMIFFSQKVLRELPGNWTFVIVTDRKELDDQIYKNFSSSGAVTEPQKRVRAQSGDHLKRLLQEDHRFVFTLIQKFHTEKGDLYPELSDRSDIIVITDEAHRSQYDVLALNMRNALPQAAFIGFTGTPLMAGEERTRQVFGDYVSIYNFKQSANDHATVPLYYENRIPELQLTNEDFQEEMEHLLDEAMLDEDQEQKLEREFSRQYHLITREKRLETIARDLVDHFVGRGFRAKAMMISIDKATAVKMYDKVSKHWKLELDELKRRLAACEHADEREELADLIQYVEETDMAVVVSQAQNEIQDLRAKGVDIKPHRKRMVAEDLDTKFKDGDDPLRIVFVCAMWITGFDVPSCSTMYLDKPMRNHTLMQTIARANRVFGEKVNGLIVDYVGIFRDLEKALSIYGSASGGGVDEGEMPVELKQALVDKLNEAIEETDQFCLDRGVSLNALMRASELDRVKQIEDAANALLVNDDIKRRYLLLANNVDRYFKAILPDKAANEFGPKRKAVVVLADKIRSYSPEVDISHVMDAVEDLLDKSVAPTEYIIKEKSGVYDLSRIDFETLKEMFEKGHKRIEIEKLRGMINNKLKKMVRLNRTRMNYVEKFKQMIDEYNSGASSEDVFFAKLVALAQDMNEEERRHVAEQLTEEELALFDLLTKPDMKLSRKEKDQVKKIARDLLDTLTAERIVLDWRKHQQSRAAVRLCIEEMLDKLPPAYTTEKFQDKCNLVFQHIYDDYWGKDRSIYSLPHHRMTG